MGSYFEEQITRGNEDLQGLTTEKIWELDFISREYDNFYFLGVRIESDWKNIHDETVRYFYISKPGHI